MEKTMLHSESSSTNFIPFYFIGGCRARSEKDGDYITMAQLIRRSGIRCSINVCDEDGTKEEQLKVRSLEDKVDALSIEVGNIRSAVWSFQHAHRVPEVSNVEERATQETEQEVKQVASINEQVRTHVDELEDVLVGSSTSQDMHERLNELLNVQAPLWFFEFVIQGINLGICAHAVMLASEWMANVNFVNYDKWWHTQGASYGPIEIFQMEMESRSLAYGSNSPNTFPSSYRGVGDSIAIADLLTSYLQHASLRASVGAVLPTLFRSHCFIGNFWVVPDAGATICDSDSFKRLYTNDGGVGEVMRIRYYIEHYLRNNGIINSNILDPSINRHTISSQSLSLNDDGRKLLLALLTMHSSNVLFRHVGCNTFIYYYTIAGYVILPDNEIGHWCEETDEREYGRYHTLRVVQNGRFRRGAIDPITLYQACTFLAVGKGGHLIRHKRRSVFAYVEIKGRDGISISNIALKPWDAISESTLNEYDAERKLVIEEFKNLLTIPCNEQALSFERTIINKWTS